jgi:hypothetical protein
MLPMRRCARIEWCWRGRVPKTALSLSSYRFSALESSPGYRSTSRYSAQHLSPSIEPRVALQAASKVSRITQLKVNDEATRGGGEA